MIDYKTPTLTGATLGIIHGLVLWAAQDDSFKLASMIIYKDPYLLSFYTVAIVDAVIMITVITSGLWLPRLLAFRDKVVEGNNRD